MAIVITYNPDIFSIYQTFYTAKKVDLMESLAWLAADEKSMGVSQEQGNLIVQLAQFYFTIIQLLNQTINQNWSYLDWLTQSEYDKIMYKLSLAGVTPDIINIPGMMPGAVPITSPSGTTEPVITIINIPVGTTRYSLYSETKPIAITLYDNSGHVITGSLGLDFSVVDGFYVLDITNDSDNEMTDVELNLLY